MSPRGLWEDEHDCAAIEEALGHAVQDADELRARVKRLEEALGWIELAAMPVALTGGAPRPMAAALHDLLTKIRDAARAALKDTEGTRHGS